MKKLSIILSVFVIVAGIGIFTTCKSTKTGIQPTAGILRGYVYAQVTDNTQRAEEVFLPDVLVTIKDAAGVAVDSVLTKFDGNYATKKLKTGRYKICLSKNGFALSCYDASVTYASNHPGPLKLNFADDNYIWGTVKLADGSAGYYNQQVFNVHIDTRVTVTTKPDSVRCNIFGYYVMPGIDPKAKSAVKASCENSNAAAPINGQKRIDLVFRNSDPVINSLAGYNPTGKSILRTLPGTTIKIVADVTSPAGHPLHYRWLPFGKFPGFVSSDAKEVVWQLPAQKGKYEMDLMVLDGFGGATYKAFNVVAGDGKVNFSGIVTNIADGSRIPGAMIRINGTALTTTDAKGYFSAKVPENDKERYVLNIIKPGFSLSSQIYMNEAVQKNYGLVPATTLSFDPKKDISITERPDKYTRLENKNSSRSPAILFIPKNSIADSAGHLVTDSVNVSIRSVDITNANGQMPGNFGGVKDGKNVRLESYGAVDVQIRNKANPNIKYNLVSTDTASLSIPILSTQMGKAAKNIALWDYNETTGLWENVGSLVKTGNYYKGITHKFSVLNADFDYSSGTYIVLNDNPSNSVFSYPGPITIKLFLPLAGGGVQQGYHVFNNLQPSDVVQGFPVVNVAANTVITIQIISNGNVINTLNPRTGNLIPGSVGLPPPSPSYPYDPAALQVLMMPTIPNLAQNQLDQFLTAEQNAYGGPNALSDANNYYTYIGASNYTKDVNGNTVAPHPITFPEWKAKNGYDAVTGQGDNNSVYFNAGDLRFWRGMHEKTFNGATSFYVSNFNTDVDDINNVNAIATVCMEYSPIVAGGGNINVTKFYVFNGAGALVNAANLDNNNLGANNGLKYVPGLCITCHGGAIEDYTSDPSITSAATLQAYFNSNPADVPNFLPFDLKSFDYSTGTNHTRADEEDHLRALNNAVLQVSSPGTSSRTQAIVDFVNTAYNNHSNTSGQGFIDNFVVDAGGSGSTWNTTTLANTVNPADFYVDVIGTSCRTCHIARTDPGIWWDTKSGFVLKKTSIAGNFGLVCSATSVIATAGTRAMPNSKVTFINFWTNQAPQRNVEIGKLLNNNPNSCVY